MKNWERWTDEDVRKLKEYVDVGLSNYEIADIMGKTYGIINNAMNRYGIKRDRMVAERMRCPSGEDSPNWKGGKTASRERCRINRREYSKEYYENNREKYYAKRDVSRAIKAGSLKKQPCEVCERLENVEAHHDDYSKPLEVRWLCPLHHKGLHVKLRQREVECV